jgi:hypothetical protein
VTIELSHVGEAVITELLSRLSAKGRLDRVCCNATGASLVSDLDPTWPRFLADAAQLRISSDEVTYSCCDGAQTVDVLCVGQQRAVAIEAKLGLTRMSPSEFPKRFCHPCGVSGHADPRLTGSMIAVLDRLLPFTNGRVVATVNDQSWPLAPNWWLVLRAPVWRGWAARLPVRFARILVFDELVALYRGRGEFDDLVRHVVGTDFASRWGLELDP